MSNGRVITVFAAKDGSGKSTIATNLAVALCDRGKRRVCMVDLDLQFGDVACMFGLQPEHSLCDAVQWVGGLTTEHVGGVLTPYRPGLDCVLAPAGPGEAREIPHQLVGELLGVLPVLYDYVVVDTPGQFGASVLEALDAADHQVLVGSPERPSLTQLRQTLDVLDLLYGSGQRTVVVNRYDERVGLGDEDLDQLLRSPDVVRVPNWTDVPAAINRGEPLVAGCPDHPVSRAVRSLADSLVVTDGRCSRDPPSA